MKLLPGYRTPKVEEFVQGFEYEYSKKIKALWMNTSGTETEEENRAAFKALNDATPWTIVWRKGVVHWKHDPSEIITEVDEGIEWKVTGQFANLFKPFDE